MTPSLRQRSLGCLLGGAVGDALGAPVEFLRRSEILSRFGPQGIRRYAPAYGRLGAITDDTQMALFTAEGLLRSWVRGYLKGISSHVAMVGRSYLRWLSTQGVEVSVDPDLCTGWLITQRELHTRRAPGMTCVSALHNGTLGEPATNDSKGCGGVMRMAPAGLFVGSLGDAPERAFGLGVELAALTHGHPTGQLAAGAFAVIIASLCTGGSMDEGLDAALGCLRDEPHGDETVAALRQARDLASGRGPSAEALQRLGDGWLAHEALAIAVYSALVAADFSDGIALAVNHDGDSDSTGAMTGNLLGAQLGINAIPAYWLDALELRDTITQLGEDLAAFPSWDLDEDALSDVGAAVVRRYPGY